MLPPQRHDRLVPPPLDFGDAHGGRGVLLVARRAGTSVAMIERAYGHFRNQSYQEAQARLDRSREQREVSDAGNATSKLLPALEVSLLVARNRPRRSTGSRNAEPLPTRAGRVGRGDSGQDADRQAACFALRRRQAQAKPRNTAMPAPVSVEGSGTALTETSSKAGPQIASCMLSVLINSSVVKVECA